MLKIGVVVASAGGPARMPFLFEEGCPEDAVWLILQRHADLASLERLTEALGEMTGRKVALVREGVHMHGGDIWVLPSDAEYVLEANRIVPQTAKGPLQLDRFFLNLCEAKAALACVLLTGPALEGQGLAGLKALSRSGAMLYGLEGLSGPARTALEQAKHEGLVLQALPCRGALAQVRFGKPVAEALRG